MESDNTMKANQDNDEQKNKFRKKQSVMEDMMEIYEKKSQWL